MRNLEPIGLDGRGSGLLAKYGLEAVSDPEVRNLVVALIQTVGVVQDSLPKDIVDESDVLALEDAIREAHFPSNQIQRSISRWHLKRCFCIMWVNG